MRKTFSVFDLHNGKFPSLKEYKRASPPQKSVINGAIGERKAKKLIAKQFPDSKIIACNSFYSFEYFFSYLKYAFSRYTTEYLQPLSENFDRHFKQKVQAEQYFNQFKKIPHFDLIQYLRFIGVGLPDYIILHKGKFKLIEVKTNDFRLRRKEQKIVLDKYSNLVDCFVLKITLINLKVTKHKWEKR